MTCRSLIAAVVPLILVCGLAGCTGKSLIGRGSGGTAQTQQTSPASDPSTTNPYTKPEIAAAKLISGLVYHPEPDHNHQSTTVSYDTTPPTGGDHSPIWADCAGRVYPNAIANENAVHMLEHGAVWITYQPGLPADRVATLSKLVEGVDRMALSPYPDLKQASPFRRGATSFSSKTQPIRASRSSSPRCGSTRVSTLNPPAA